ncbi:MAG TPA: PDZ domain-containing protein [Pyrinomonadaceae bacterium]|jgi:serine protease Do|nr:PDZ domain-containing protein [Pyrinomonadaceae bacterium]
MDRKLLLAPVAFFLLLAPGARAGAQETAPVPPSQPTAPSAPSVTLSPVQPFPAIAPAMALFAGDNFLGVEAEEVTSENSGRYALRGEARGVGVSRVLKGSPAERAGIRENDVIVRFDGEAVTSVRKLNRLIDESAPGHVARLTVLRNGSEQEISATLGKREGGLLQGLGDVTPLTIAPAQIEELRRRAEELHGRGDEMKRYGEEARKQAEELRRNNPNLFNNHELFALSYLGGRRIGVSTTGLGKQLADYFGVSEDGGALVNSVEENSPADKAGLKAGDVIVEVDDQKITDTGQLSRAIGRKNEGDVTLTIVRDRKRRKIKVTPERRGMTPFNLTPGTYIAPPVAALAPRSLVPLRALTAPRVTAVPLVAPRVVAPRVVMPRLTVPRTLRAPHVNGKRVL